MDLDWPRNTEIQGDVRAIAAWVAEMVISAEEAKKAR